MYTQLINKNKCCIQTIFSRYSVLSSAHLEADGVLCPSSCSLPCTWQIYFSSRLPVSEKSFRAYPIVPPFCRIPHQRFSLSFHLNEFLLGSLASASPYSRYGNSSQVSQWAFVLQPPLLSISRKCLFVSHQVSCFGTICLLVCILRQGFVMLRWLVQ